LEQHRIWVNEQEQRFWKKEFEKLSDDHKEAYKEFWEVESKVAQELFPGRVKIRPPSENGVRLFCGTQSSC
jgi:hypothetical protein